ncbi:MAG TPA: hypothetical protein VF643_01850 [Sphingomonas sp.]|jgi:hypothetical protein
MIGFPASIPRTDEFGVVRRPLPSDALGSALRDIYGELPPLPEDMRRLLHMLDRAPRGH